MGIDVASKTASTSFCAPSTISCACGSSKYKLPTKGGSPASSKKPPTAPEPTGAKKVDAAVATLVPVTEVIDVFVVIVVLVLMFVDVLDVSEVFANVVSVVPKLDVPELDDVLEELLLCESDAVPESPPDTTFFAAPGFGVLL